MIFSTTEAEYVAIYQVLKTFEFPTHMITRNTPQQHNHNSMPFSLPLLLLMLLLLVPLIAAVQHFTSSSSPVSWVALHPIRVGLMTSCQK